MTQVFLDLSDLEEDDGVDFGEIKAIRRDRKYKKKVHGMQMDGRSIFVLEEIERKRLEKLGGQDGYCPHETFKGE